jgi:LytS/YehU family sensor histidine kinase
MNKKLIFQLSLFGLAMAFATVYFIPSNVEPLCWLAIFIVCAYLIAKNCTEKYFLNGLCVSLVNAIWITAIHILLFDTYIANHLDEAAMMTKMPIPNNPKLMMLMTGPIVGIISGLVLGLFAFTASKIMKKKK